ncbi:uncharacterized protein [Amphiura filiformis]|uniref:uncharacterized protein n=1 Tax=Amphiura filiformis TaxID=82378 RepID=UPI003B22715C
MSLSVVAIALLLGVAAPVYGHHFRGGSFHWRPLDEPNQVEVTYNMGFNGFRVMEPGEWKTIGHDVCRHVGTNNLRTIGNLICDECVGGTPYDYGLLWHCTDLNEKSDWDMGGKIFQVTVPADTKRAVIYYQVCCWVNPIQNVWPHTQLGWRMNTEIDLNPRLDNGLINSSPITSPIPLQLFHTRCKYWLEIPVTDPDDDAYRCRYTNASLGECYEGYKNTMCGELDYITIYPNCTLLFDTSGPVGYYAVRVMIEDLDQYGDPLSKVSLSFLLNVSSDSTTCEVPKIIEPVKSCRTVQVNQHLHIDVVAQAATARLPIDHIETNKPRGMITSALADVEGHSLRKAVTLNWTPLTDQIGRHNLGFSGVDVRGFASTWSFITLNVVTGDELFPMPESSDPSRDQTKTSLKEWTISFNRPVHRPPQSAYIVLLDQSGNIASKIDSSDPRQCKFRDNFIEFDVHLNDAIEGTQSFRLQVNEGVAIDEEPGNCVMQSKETEWTVNIEGNEPAFTQAPITKLAPVPPQERQKCAEGYMNVTAPARIKPGQQCEIRPLTDHIIVPTREDTKKPINIPYEICCGGNCNKYNC